ncbi:MAG: pyridoxal phosphate-dependent aminotransferase [Sandaracinaceae bacterium]|nr:pyridoxal phosphate-dependent aminotransferase [Sandaracinaceae bacterium]
MTFELASRVRSMPPSATLAITQRASELAAAGHDVIGFGVGQPDFVTPSHILDAAREALTRSSGYTAVRGIGPLLEAIRDESLRRRRVAHDTSEIVVSVGAKHTLFNLAMVLYEPGDEVIIPAPYWVSYPAQVELFGGVPKIVETHEADGFRLSPDALRAAVSPRTKAIILCSPSNPTGAAYRREDLEALAGALREGDYWILTDEIYGELVYDGFDQVSLLEVAPDLRDRLIVVDGVSKTYAMTGWRIGWALAPAAVAKAVDKVQGQSTTNPTAVAQHAAVAALRGDKAPVAAMVAAFAERRRAIVDGLNAIDGISCREPEGAFYAFPNVTGLLGRSAGGQVLTDDLAVGKWLLETAGCALVPGTEFGAPGFLRMSYATSMDNIERGLAKIRAAVAELG